MNTVNAKLLLWEECKNIFLNSDNNRLKDLLKKVLEIIRENYDIFRKKADLDFLDFVIKMDADEYIIGTNGDDFQTTLRSKADIPQENISVDKIWRILAQLMWDLTVPVTDKVCPHCRCGNLVLLVDKERKNIYESCENCFWISENEIQIKRPDDLFPAGKREWKSNADI